MKRMAEILLKGMVCLGFVLSLFVSPSWSAAPLGKRVVAGPGKSVPAGRGQGHWRTYGVTEGLADNRVRTIIQDRDGLLWIGTNGGGVSRFDGATFTTFSVQDGLGSRGVYAIFQDRNGLIWFATSGGVSCYDPSSSSRSTRSGQTGKVAFTTLTTKDGLAHNRTTSIIQDRKGKIWIGTRGGGVSCYDPSAGSEQDAFISFTTQDGLASLIVISIFQDRDGVFWFGTSSGLSRYDPSAESIPSKVEGLRTGSPSFTNFTTKDGLAHNSVSSIFQDRDGLLWFGTGGGGVSCFDGKSFTSFTTKDGLVSNSVRSIIQDRDGLLWFSMAGGVSCYDGRRFTNFTTEDGLAHHTVQSVVQDREGALWFGTYGGGVSRYDREVFTTFTTTDGLGGTRVFSIIQDHKGLLWFGARDGGVSQFDGETFTTFTTQDGLAHNKVFSIFQDQEKALWFATEGGGVSRYDGETFTTFTTKDGLAHNSVLSVFQDRKKTFWFGTEGGGVSRYDPSASSGQAAFATLTRQDGLGGNTVGSIVQDREGVLWFGFLGGGVSRFDHKVFTTFTTRDGLGNAGVIPIIQDRDGVFWFGTYSGGVSRYDPAAESIPSEAEGLGTDSQMFTTFTTKDGLAHNSIISGIVDRDGTLWFGTFGGGVSRYDGKTFVTLTTRDGLAHNNVASIFQDRDGVFWFGTQGGGVTRYRPPAPFPPPVFIDAVLADRRYEGVSEVAFPSTVEITVFDFHGISLKTQPESMVYRYRLQGYETDWNTTHERRVEYQNLPIGNYTFEVQAVDRDQVYSETPATVTLTVHLPYERIGWMSSLGLAILLIGWQAVRIIRRDQRLQETNNALSDANHELFDLNKDLQQKTEDLELASEHAQQANQAKSRFLASMSHELRTPLNGILGYAQILDRDKGLSAKQRDGVGIIQRSGDHLLGLINDILDLARIEAEKIELEEKEIGLSVFLENVSAISAVKAQEKGLTFVSDVSPDLPEVVMGDPRRLRQVLLNLLGNAMKFTEKGEVKFSIGIVSQKDDQIRVRFEVTDSGVGMTEQEAQEVFKPFEQAGGADKRAEGTGLGLAISQQLVGLMGGEIQVESELGKGSRFWFEADLKTMDDQSIAFAQEERVPVGFKGDARQVLVVDDTTENRAVLISLLEPLGFEVLEAEDGQASLDLAMESKPDVILLDMVMPVLDGFETARKLRQIDELKDMVVIALSASVFEEERQQSLDAGCTDFLPKPVIAEDLLQKLSTHLDLEWVYGESDVVTAEEVVNGEMVIPPADALKPLFEMAQKGQIFGIEEQIDGIAKLGDEYRPFVVELQNLAEDFKVDQICTLIKPHLSEQDAS